jgi:1,4-alpha-glucan branching enzyme
MISKAKAGKSKYRVTFKFMPDWDAKKGAVCGEFNNWDSHSDPMIKRKDGSFSATVTIDAGRSYQFRYFFDDERWENDDAADGYVSNVYGTEDSRLDL